MTILNINTKSIKFKIVLYSTISLLLIGSLSNIIIYRYSNSMLSHKVNVIDNMNINNISSQIDTRLTNLSNLTLLITNNVFIQKVLEYSSLNTSFSKVEGLKVQNTMTNYIDSSLVNTYVKKAIVFNKSNLIIESVGKDYGYLDDYDRITNSQIFKLMRKSPELNNQVISKPVISTGELCLPVLKPIYSLSSPDIIGWLYMEIDLKLITNILASFNAYTNLFVTTKTNNIIHSNNLIQLNYDDILKNKDFYYKEYFIKSYNINKYNWTIYTVENFTNLNIEAKNMLSIFYITVLISLIAGLLIFIGVSNNITKPIKSLKTRIKKISLKDFSYDYETENLQGEIGEIGRVINEMASDMEQLLHQAIEITNEKKNFEIAMLQSQVNPHFLYNTLNSIHWMASLQKNTGICNLVDALTNLLKNMANSFSDKVTLKEELKLLNDYITIQSIRYMESFEFVNNINHSLYDKKIVKMTLQPLVENAIFHGIEPKGKFGTIVLDGQIKDNYMLITVTDDGVGISEEEILKLKEKKKGTTKGSINGIGLNNVNLRLKLMYGDDYGLNIKSELSKYTAITIKIPIEE